MSPPPKGKPPTKGAKQIVAENETTVTFYRRMIILSIILHIIINAFYLFKDVAMTSFGLFLLATVLQFLCYYMMDYLSQPTYADSMLLNPGVDLNLEGGMGEHAKDIVILISFINIATTLSGYFWLLLLILPVRAIWLLWFNVLGPWFFQEAPVDSEHNEKKRKKMERKMMRH